MVNRPGSLAFPVLLAMALAAGCNSAGNPPGTGASGKKLEVSKEPAGGVPDDVANAKPGSGKGVGGGDGQGRSRNPELAGKAGHERGAGGKKGTTTKSDADSAPTHDSPKAEDKDAPNTEEKGDAKEPEVKDAPKSP